MSGPCQKDARLSDLHGRRLALTLGRKEKGRVRGGLSIPEYAGTNAGRAQQASKTRKQARSRALPENVSQDRDRSPTKAISQAIMNTTREASTFSFPLSAMPRQITVKTTAVRGFAIRPSIEANIQTSSSTVIAGRVRLQSVAPRPPSALIFFREGSLARGGIFSRRYALAPD
jgi:hypothetical protein